jgi:glutathione peroxidase
MTYRRKLLKWIYPAFRWLSKGSRGTVSLNMKLVAPPCSFYELSATDNNGETISFSSFRGKYVLVVNTASDCGYTPQYAELQQIYIENKKNFVVIGFPSNDFKQQEAYSDEEIAVFCAENYHITFPVAMKANVLGPGKHAVYQWLTDPAKNGWNSTEPEWNFSKYLIDREGLLTHYFGPAVPPKDIQKQLS